MSDPDGLVVFQYLKGGNKMRNDVLILIGFVVIAMMFFKKDEEV